VQQGHEPFLDGRRHDVLPATGFVVDERDVEADDVEEQPLHETVLAHHLDGLRVAPRG